MAGLTGTELGNYRVEERIARGGMAEVYKGRHVRLQRDVAIKVLYSFLAEGEDFIARFEREAQAVANLRHPGIVQVYDFDSTEDHCYMVMEYIDGMTLTHWLRMKGGKATADEILNIMEQIAAPLDYAHTQGVIHRDIKPSNIMLDNSGKVFLADFGIARIVSSTQFTATGTLIGTPAYMSPEQCRGDGVSTISDIYSLGVILYEILTGHQPYEADTPLSVLQKHITEPVPSLRRYDATLPASYERIIRKAMEKNPMERYQSAAELVDDLREAIALSMAPTKEVDREESDSTELPTLAMEDTIEAEVTLSQKPTVVMEDEEDDDEGPIGQIVEELAEEAVEEVIEEAIDRLKDEFGGEESAAETLQSEDALEEEMYSQEISADAPLEFKPPAPKKFPFAITIPVGLAVVTLAALIITGVIPLGGGGEDEPEPVPVEPTAVPDDEGGGEANTEFCDDPWGCRDRGIEAWDVGQREIAADYYWQAVELIDGPAPDYMPIWCEGAELFTELERWDESGIFSAMCFLASNGADGCEGVQDCAGYADRAAEAGQFWVADTLYSWAIGHVPEGDEPEWAYLWCRRAEMMDAVDQPGLSEEFLTICDEWSR